MHEKLTEFVEHALDKGMDHATIRRLLLSAGWKESAISEVFCARDLELTIPAPPKPVPVKRSGRGRVPRKARDAFLHLLAFGSLYASSTSLIVLLFIYLDMTFPDPAWRTSHAQVQQLLTIIRIHLSIVIVAFPLFMATWTYLLRELRTNPETGKGVLRRWLGNLSLFIGAVTLSGNTITLIYFLLEGQLTTRFVLKAIALFLIAGGLVVYLALTLRAEARCAATTETDS